MVETNSMPDAIVNFEANCVSPIWYSQTVFFDPEFQNDVFSNYLKSCDMSGRPHPPHRNNKNVLKSKQRIIPDNFIHQAAEEDDESQYVQCYVQMTLRISNDLNDNEGMSSNELANGYNRLIKPGYFLTEILRDVLSAHETLQAKRTLTPILRSKLNTDTPVTIGDLVQELREPRAKCEALAPLQSPF